MKDNNVPEEVVTLEDSPWVTGPNPGEYTGEMVMYKNWTYGGTSAFGSILACIEGSQKLKSKWVMHGKWVWLEKTSFMYLLDENDVLKRPDGTLPAFTPGVDILRITWAGDNLENMDVSKPFFLYLVRKIAFLDGSGQLVKTPAYNELKERTERPDVKGCCCNYGLCNIPVDRYEEIFMPISDAQYVEFHS